VESYGAIANAIFVTPTDLTTLGLVKDAVPDLPTQDPSS
jgi:hypothetical protein